jgi:predicted transcriptional regulator
MRNVTSSFELPEDLKKKLIECARRSGRKQTLVVRAALYHFITLDQKKQESLVNKYLQFVSGNVTLK